MRRHILFYLYLFLFLGAGCLLPQGAGYAAESARPPAWRFRLSAGMEARYDDNILGLSDKEKDQVDPSDPSNVSQFKISRPDDVIFSPAVAVAFDHEPRGGRETTIRFAATSYPYVENPVKNHAPFGASLRQDLNSSREHRTSLVVGGSVIPEYYLRQLRDDDASDPNAGVVVYNAADYQLNRGYLEIWQDVVDRALSLVVTYARERRNYNVDFNERDSSSDVFSLDINVYPLRERSFRLRPYAEWERRETRGDLTASTVVDDDVGFDSSLYGLDARWIWGKDQGPQSTLRGYYQREVRSFASDNPTDTGHFEREDDIARFGVSFNRDIARGWEWGAFAWHRDNDVSTSSSDFVRNVVSVFVGYQVDRRMDRLRSGARGDE